MNKFRCIYALAFLAIFSLSASPIFANGVRTDLGASGKGVVNPPGGCPATIVANPACVNFDTTGALPTWTSFNLISDSPLTFTTTGPYDLFVESNISSITFQLNGNAVFGSFLCGSDQANMSSALDGDCTLIGLDGIDPPVDLTGFLSLDDSNLASLNQVTYNFLNGAIDTSNGVWVFYATSGNATVLSTTPTTSTPEPCTLLLFASGVFLIAAMKYRRTYQWASRNANHSTPGFGLSQL